MHTNIIYVTPCLLYYHIFMLVSCKDKITGSFPVWRRGVCLCVYESNAGNETVKVFVREHCMHLCVCVKSAYNSESPFPYLSVDVCAADKQPRPLLHPLGSLLSCLNMPQWSSPKERNPCQMLPAPSALAPSQGPMMPAPDPRCVAPTSLPRSSVLSTTSQLIGWWKVGAGVGGENNTSFRKKKSKLQRIKTKKKVSQH